MISSIFFPSIFHKGLAQFCHYSYYCWWLQTESWLHSSGVIGNCRCEGTLAYTSLAQHTGSALMAPRKIHLSNARETDVLLSHHWEHSKSELVHCLCMLLVGKTKREKGIETNWRWLFDTIKKNCTKEMFFRANINENYASWVVQYKMQNKVFHIMKERAMKSLLNGMLILVFLVANICPIFGMCCWLILQKIK